MFNRLITFFKENILFFVFSFLALSFLIFQEGYWLYVDSAGWPLTFDRYIQYVYQGLNSFTNMSYFGFDATTISSSRLLQTFTKILPMGILYFSFFVFSFLSSYFLLKIQFSKKASFYGALLFTFNPVSLYFLKQVGYLYSYFSLPLIILSIYYFFKTHKIKYILLLLFGILFFLSYTRLTGIYLVFLIFLGFYYNQFLISLFKKQKKYILLVFILILIVTGPFLLSLIFPHLSGNKEYFTGLGNYADSFNSYQKSFYNSIQNTPFIQSFYLKEIVHDFADLWEKSYIFIFFSIILISGNIYYFLFSKNNNKIKKSLYILLLFLFFIIFIKSGAKFLNVEIFSAIAYKYFPFIANNANWLYLIYVPILVYVFAYNFNFGSIKTKIIFKYGAFIYIFISIFPLLNYTNNVKSQLVDINNMSENYKKTFNTTNKNIQSTLYFPQSALYLEGNPYHIKLNNNNNFLELFHDDKRSVNSKQQKLKNFAYKYSLKNSTNLSLFNLKNIFVFKDIKNTTNSTFDWYRGYKLKEKSEKQYKKLKNNYNLYIKQDNKNFAQFGLKNDNHFEYFIYSPANIIRKDLNNFFKEKVDIKNKIVNIDKKSFHKPEKIDNFTISETNKNIKINYKKSKTNSTKYYVKISNFDKNNPFLLQFNQTFGMSWKLKWIRKEEFENKKCLDIYKNYSITDNSVCNYKENYFKTLLDYIYLSKKEVKEQNHFEGNFVGNTWLVEPDDLPKNSGKELYAVIIYEKQIYYIWTLIISGLTFLVLMLLTLIQEFILFLNKNNKKGTL